LQLAARHESSAAQEVRWAVLQWLDQQEPLAGSEGAEGYLPAGNTTTTTITDDPQDT
jgi:hypothetical protein